MLALVAGIFWGQTRPATAPTDETIVVSMSIGVGLAFVIAVVNRLLRLKLLSRMAERVTFVLIPPRGVHLLSSFARTGLATVTKSSRIWFVTCS